MPLSRRSFLGLLGLSPVAAPAVARALVTAPAAPAAPATSLCLSAAGTNSSLCLSAAGTNSSLAFTIGCDGELVVPDDPVAGFLRKPAGEFERLQFGGRPTTFPTLRRSFGTDHYTCFTDADGIRRIIPLHA